MIDVFFCSLSECDDLRSAMAETCLQRWIQLSDLANIVVLDETLLNCSPLGFQRMRRIASDEMSSGDIYVVADDDCLLPKDFDLVECVGVFRSSGFSSLSLMPSNCSIQEWTPEQYITENTPDVMEHVSAGHIRFCKKGHLKKWPMMADGFPGYDAIHADAIRSEGGRVGYFRNHKALHLGEGFSTVWSK